MEVDDLVEFPHINTRTTLEQEGVELYCRQIYAKYEQNGKNSTPEKLPELDRESIRNFLLKGLRSLSSGYQNLDASRPWLMYWIVHSLELLRIPIPEAVIPDIILSLKHCHNSTGGFGGGPGQISHLAPTYAAVNTLCIIGTPEAWSIIDRQKLAEWLNSLRLSNGSFLMHHDGEIDIRGVYCAVSVAKLTNIFSEDLFKHTVSWIKSCQTHEGGFGPVPYMEAHGGYSFCAIAALSLFGDVSGIRLDKLARWTSKRQMKLEGGFQGRTNKLVDSCYSFWQGAILPILDAHLVPDDKKKDEILPQAWLYNQINLQRYLLICCQDPRGGLIDKPGKSRDYYHTCYALSGLSIAQHSRNKKFVYGNASNELKPSHVLYNIGVDAVSKALEFFKNFPVPLFD
ncbi:protein farnesyltransferase subunit beta [Lepeophtheirus salmonis]|nr:protein farnesyltransferase subunit beta-like [Lepeophtheirus salmonis]